MVFAKSYYAPLMGAYMIQSTISGLKKKGMAKYKISKVAVSMLTILGLNTAMIILNVIYMAISNNTLNKVFEDRR
jgi:hypothetical protein